MKWILVDSFISSTRHGIEFNIEKDGMRTRLLRHIPWCLKSEFPDQLEAVKQELVQDKESFLSTPVGQFEQAINQNIYRLEAAIYS
ncbi:hypothetical protein OH492_13320 [Vibrio chagasii]|nr:hypothetical protein [Vibrio chagasii]